MNHLRYQPQLHLQIHFLSVYQPHKANFQQNQDAKSEDFLYLHPLLPKEWGLLHSLHQDMHNILPQPQTEQSNTAIEMLKHAVIGSL